MRRRLYPTRSRVLQPKLREHQQSRCPLGSRAACRAQTARSEGVRLVTRNHLNGCRVFVVGRRVAETKLHDQRRAARMLHDRDPHWPPRNGLMNSGRRSPFRYLSPRRTRWRQRRLRSRARARATRCRWPPAATAPSHGTRTAAPSPAAPSTRSQTRVHAGGADAAARAGRRSCSRPPPCGRAAHIS